MYIYIYIYLCIHACHNILLWCVNTYVSVYVHCICTYTWSHGYPIPNDFPVQAVHEPKGLGANSINAMFCGEKHHRFTTGRRHRTTSFPLGACRKTGYPQFQRWSFFPRWNEGDTEHIFRLPYFLWASSLKAQASALANSNMKSRKGASELFTSPKCPCQGRVESKRDMGPSKWRCPMKARC